MMILDADLARLALIVEEEHLQAEALTAAAGEHMAGAGAALRELEGRLLPQEYAQLLAVLEIGLERATAYVAAAERRGGVDTASERHAAPEPFPLGESPLRFDSGG
jgi:hypothetical protein